MIGSFFKYGTRYTAIEYAEKNIFNFLQLVKKKNELLIHEKNQFQKEVDCIQHLKNEKHAFLIVNNEEVLSKKIDFLKNDNAYALKTAFPNIKIRDFYYEVYHTPLASFVSIIRKSYIDALLEKYTKNGIAIIDFSLGNLALQNIKTFIEVPTVYTSNKIVSFEEQELLHIEEATIKKSKYTINSLEVSSDNLLTLSGILSYYSGRKISILSNQLYQNYIQKRQFTVGLKSALGFLLTILLLNVLFFSNYRDQLNILSEELELTKTYKQQLLSLQENVDQKNKLAESITTASTTEISKIIEEIAVSVPNRVLLNALKYQPLESTMKDQKELLFNESTILIKGISRNNLDFSNWTSFLERKAWVKNLTILDYGKGKKSNTSSSFELQIKIGKTNE